MADAKGVILRHARLSDAPMLQAIYAPYVLHTAVSFEWQPPTAEEFAARMEKTMAFYPYFTACLDGRIVGYAYASRFQPRKAYDWCAEASVYLAMDARRQGIGAKLYAALEDALRLQHIRKLYAKIVVPGEEDEYLTFDSLSFHRAMGFTQQGFFTDCGNKFGRWYSICCMEKDLTADAPLEPVTAFRPEDFSF